MMIEEIFILNHDWTYGNPINIKKIVPINKAYYVYIMKYSFQLYRL